MHTDILYVAPSQDFLSSEDFQHLYGVIGTLCAVNPPVDAQQQMEVLRETMSALVSVRFCFMTKSEAHMCATG